MIVFDDDDGEMGGYEVRRNHGACDALNDKKRRIRREERKVKKKKKKKKKYWR